jgi:hypothetical protein
LWSARTAYPGDNSHVAALVSAAGFGPEGTYSIALQTGAPPYGVTVVFQTLDKPFADIDFSVNATLLLGLVGNLDQVSVTSGQRTYSLSAVGASHRLGYDVKVLGRDRSKLTAYLDADRD